MASLFRQLTTVLALKATTSWTSCRRKATPMMRSVLMSHSSLLSSSCMRGLLPQASQSYVNWRMRRGVRIPNLSCSPGPDESNWSSSFGAEATGSKKFSMLVTLVRHKESKRVVYLEGSGRFVEFLFNFLLVPVGIADVRNKLPAPCLENLYRSVEGLDLLSERDKENLLWWGGWGPWWGPWWGGWVNVPNFPTSTTFIVTDSLQVYTATSRVIMDLVSRAIERTQDLETVQVGVGDRQAKELFERAFTSDTVLNDVFGPH